MNAAHDDRAPAAAGGLPLLLADEHTRAGSPKTARARVRGTRLLPAARGGPVHCGDPSVLGTGDPGRPGFGGPVAAAPDDGPAFRACGATPQAAVAASRPPFAIAHAPGRMSRTGARGEQCRVARRAPRAIPSARGTGPAGGPGRTRRPGGPEEAETLET
ncbi:hypothetical protein SUDANB6_05025 [Streptomyces sp. enrichment culture]